MTHYQNPTTQRRLQQMVDTMKPGQYLICDILGYPLRVQNIITSYLGLIFKMEAGRQLTRVHG